MNSNKKQWDIWELVAINYLQKKWYKILDTNFKYWRFWEIDIVSKIANLTVFIEVKYRENLNFWTPEESITKSKLAKFSKTIDYYCFKNNISTERIRFDAITILKWEKSYKLKHYENLSLR